MMGKLVVVVGGQYGSEAKGAVSAALAAKERGLCSVVRVGGSNAGHTVVDSEGQTWKLRHIPTAAVTNAEAVLALGPGSEIDCDVLGDEIEKLEGAGYKILDRLVVDQHATLVDPVYMLHEMEADLVRRIGSTGKGIGAARAARIMRTAMTFGGTGDVRETIRETLARGGTVLVEGTQGYGLGLHTDNYPKCTSSDCDATAMLSMAGAVPWCPDVEKLEVWVVFRTLPIRVAGNSGKLRNETSWAELGVPEEHTTVTGKVRRVGLWDPDLARDAMLANGGPGKHVKVALTGLDLLWPDLVQMRGVWTRKDDLLGVPEIKEWIMEREAEIGCEFSYIGIGPGQGDVLWAGGVGGSDTGGYVG